MAKFSKLKVGEILSETTFYKVEKLNKDSVVLKTDQGQEVEIGQEYVNQIISSGTQFDKEEKITRTELAGLFISSSNIAFQVSFNKKVKEADVLKEVLNAHQNSAPKDIEKAFKLAIKKAIVGEERILNGFHTGIQDDFGRIKVFDLDIADIATRQRQVDPREINYLIVRGVKYVAK